MSFLCHAGLSFLDYFNKLNFCNEIKIEVYLIIGYIYALSDYQYQILKKKCLIEYPPKKLDTLHEHKTNKCY